MTNKCSSCGFEYGDNDKFCSQCGDKILEKGEIDIKSEIEQFEIKNKNTSKKVNKVHFSSNNVKRFFENALVNVAIFLIALLCALCFILFGILDNHQNQKQILQYKNLMDNPSQIPLLKEPASYSELALNLKNIEAFMLMYLKNSSDNLEKKNQIFANYLTQLDKLPNVLNEKFDSKNISECANVKTAQMCVQKLENKFKATGAKVYSFDESIVLYPNYSYINDTFANFVTSDFKKYLKLKAKYNYPTSFGLNLNIKPKKLADKVAEFEKLFLTVKNEWIKDELEKSIYKDFRKFIFTPSIYSTLTQEMKKEYENAYVYYIKRYPKSNLKALVMSYVNKKRAYSEENFKNDYPYQMYNNESFDESFKNSVLEDVFVQLRKSIFTNKNSNLPLTFVYELKNAKWKKYDSNMQLESGQYVISEADENNNISIYNHAFSPMQELNILKYSKLYLISGGLYVFNQDKLSISKVTFNGKTFNLYTLNPVDITSLFPGIEVINIDTFSSYNVLIEKANSHASYIVISRYSQGWKDYKLTPIKGEISYLALPNMFSLNSQKDVVVSFGAQENQEEFSENKPSYKFTIRTYGYTEPKIEQTITQYDEKTKNEADETIEHKPNIMPKLIEEKPELDEESFFNVPMHDIVPLAENEND